MVLEVPQVVVNRLPIYYRTLIALEGQGKEVVSSQELGFFLGITPAQIRKDLSYFGRFGKQGRGYNVRRLIEHLRGILGLDRQWSLVLVGVGKLGRAILGYNGFARQGFNVVAAFDKDPEMVGQCIGPLQVQDIAGLSDTLRSISPRIGIVAVPAPDAPEVIDTLVACGIRAILNYAPVEAKAPEGVQMRNIDPVLALQSMTYYLKDRVS
ncbi:MAG TPA: redox-sensing transcriptional repressor Rex [Dehalococcoidia bacterium]|nr:redox-sensing transcriptional repressor Rex [Dehalococcoidia bacterium]HLB29563.1 redox-sensing transcriptional repressor Rex [Dehalococcoidia bacterium]